MPATAFPRQNRSRRQLPRKLTLSWVRAFSHIWLHISVVVCEPFIYTVALFLVGAVYAMAVDGQEGEESEGDMKKKLKECRKAIGGRLAYDGVNAKEEK